MNKIIKEVKSLLKRFDIRIPPVPVERIAKELGAVLSFEPFEGDGDISGVLYRKGKNVIIGVNSKHAHVRQRFTIAHEIGHLLLHDSDIFVDKVVKANFRDKRSSLAVDKEEIAANAFAAELLMPRDFVTAELSSLLEHKPGMKTDKVISNLANTFDVSTSAMEYRLINLGLITSQ